MLPEQFLLYLRFAESRWFHLLQRSLFLSLQDSLHLYRHLRRRTFLTTELRKQYSHSTCSLKLILSLDLKCVQQVRFSDCPSLQVVHTSRLRKLLRLLSLQKVQYLSLLTRQRSRKLLRLLLFFIRTASRSWQQEPHVILSMLPEFLHRRLRNSTKEDLTYLII